MNAESTRPAICAMSRPRSASRTHCPYVSRGGLKLEKGLEYFGIDPAGKVCLDVGASTGGFTDCLLQHGARKVYAVDVAYGQLDWKIRQNAAVVVLERCNARQLTPAFFAEPLDLAVMDASFISITKLIPPLLPLFGQDIRPARPDQAAVRTASRKSSQRRGGRAGRIARRSDQAGQ